MSEALDSRHRQGQSSPLTHSGDQRRPDALGNPEPQGHRAVEHGVLKGEKLKVQKAFSRLLVLIRSSKTYLLKI